MQNKELTLLDALCESIRLILGRHNQATYLPKWLSMWLRSEASDVIEIEQNLIELQKSFDVAASFHEKRRLLVDYFNNLRLQLTIENTNLRVLELVQDALIMCLDFSDEDYQAYQQFIEQAHDEEGYLDYLAKRFSPKVFIDYVHARNIDVGLPPQNIESKREIVATKDFFINGKLVDYFGEEASLKLCLAGIKKGLTSVVERKQNGGFLTIEAALGYIQRADSILQLIAAPSSSKIDYTHFPKGELGDYVQYARYLVDDIINSAGLSFSGAPKYKQHYELIETCRWFDEILREIKMKLELPLAKADV